jgi:hypothetical protein
MLEQSNLIQTLRPESDVGNCRAIAARVRP